MLAFIYSFIFVLAETEKGGGWWDKASPYLNYPGFEAWKFLNLTIFIVIMVYLLKKPLSEAFKAKRELIRAELIKAEEKKQAALAKLTTAEAKLARIEFESAEIVEKARQDAKDEKARIAVEANDEIKRLQAQAASQIDRKSQQVRLQLRRFSAEESVRLAEEKIRKNINAKKDAELVKANIKAIGGLIQQ